MVDWSTKADPAHCLCQSCFEVQLLKLYPQLRIEGDKIMGIRLKTPEEKA
jgi:hypothetical protein